MRAARLVAALLAFAGWSVVLRGLWFAPASPDPLRDLEAGGGFAATVDVYLPAVALTVLALAMVVAGFVTREWGPPALVVSLTTAAFSAWTFTRGYLLDHLPTLDTYLFVGIGLAVLALAVVTVAAAAGASTPSGSTPA